MSAGEGARDAEKPLGAEKPPAAPGPDLERLAAGRYRSRTREATARLGEALGAALLPGDVVVLTGDLGAGKTCLTGGVARGLGDEGPVTSPTFTIMCVHDAGRIPLYHFDLYRLQGPEELDDTGIFDVLDADGACLIEWGELFADDLGPERLDVAVLRDGAPADGSEPARVVELRPSGARARALAAAVDAAFAAE
jgi:tRNA threonylcarbamoyladenosine biosynthesis protein TsaE